jgi:hypothetical protein
MIRLPAEPAQEDGVVKKSRTTKRSAPKGRKSVRTASKKSARKTKTARKPARKAGVRKSKPAARKVARAAVKKSAAPKKRAPSRKAAARKDFVARPVPVTMVAAGAAASSSGEVYGEEGWREEELSAAELDTNAPELDELEAERAGPEITSETDEDPEW